MNSAMIVRILDDRIQEVFHRKAIEAGCKMTHDCIHTPKGVTVNLHKLYQEAIDEVHNVKRSQRKTSTFAIAYGQ